MSEYYNLLILAAYGIVVFTVTMIITRKNKHSRSECTEQKTQPTEKQATPPGVAALGATRTT